MHRIILALILVSLVGSTALHAQESVNHGSVSGRVLDASEAAIGETVVSLLHVDTNTSTQVATRADGRFRFSFLRLGAYELRATKDGFRPFRQRLLVSAGSAFDVPVRLTLATLTESVTVDSGDAVLETARSQIAGTVRADEIASLPLSGRNFLDIALLVPGVSPTNTGSTQLFAETSAVPGQGLSISSQRNLSNSFIIDGLSANDDAAGLSGIPLSVDAVEQFQVVTSGGQAEFGRAIGGYVNVVTRMGANETRGSVYEYFRDDALNAPNPLLGRTLPLRQHQYGGTIGGPIKRDRTFFFASLERRDLNQSGLVTISDANVAAINARLRQVGFPGDEVKTGVYSNPVNSTLGLIRVDHLAGAHQTSLRYNLYDVNAENSRGAGGLSAPSASSALDNRDHAIALSHTWTLSDRTVNETRVQWAKGDLKAPATATTGPAVSISGVANFGTLSSSPTGRATTMLEFVDTVSHHAGAHAFRGGFDLLHNDTTITFPRSVRGAYTFSSLASFLSGTYGNGGFTQTFGNPVVDQSNPNLGVFIQDEWHARSNVTVNAGLRYDLQSLDTIKTDTNNVSPRIGLVWTPGTSRRTVVRASAGLFHDRVPLRALANALLSAGNSTNLSSLRQTNVSLSPTQTGAPVFPNALTAAVATTTLPNLTTMDPNLQNARSRQGGFEIERQVDAWLLSIGGQYLKGTGLISSINQNVPTCVAAGNNNGCRPNSAYANNSRYSSAARSSYKGLHVSVSRRASAHGSLRVSYTLSKAMNNVGEFFFSGPIDPKDIEKDWARSDDDQRHRLVVHGSLRTSTAQAKNLLDALWHDFEVSAEASYYSALPLNITSGVTTVQGTGGRPLVDGQFIPRNAGEGADFFSLNLRLSRWIGLGGTRRILLIGEVFNLTNRKNVVTYNGNFGSGAYPSAPSPTFHQVTSVSDPRSGQLGLRFTF